MGVRFPPGAPRPQACHDAGIAARDDDGMKRCGRCGVVQDASEYPVRDARTRRAHTICRACRRGYCRTYYWSNSAEFNARKRDRLKKHRARNRRFIEEHLLSHPCVDCGLLDPLVMEFDHVRGRKRSAVSTLVGQAASITVIQTEIEKCVVRCANCHRRRTACTLWGRRLEPTLPVKTAGR